MTEQERKERIRQLKEGLREARARREESRLESARVLALIDLVRARLRQVP